MQVNIWDMFHLSINFIADFPPKIPQKKKKKKKTVAEIHYGSMVWFIYIFLYILESVRNTKM